eukprot:TRINITY_DN18629_c0_g1_i2.p1 TRINITY_DN18629_c0_g1~~TRINITY_DN18629_c0_g1_i2.p1  ORF type:complete len:143 (-),score=19.87 TRINITY_DN18629_c0_g1_i2:27-455(-)
MDMLTSLSRLQTFAEGRQPTYVSSLLQLLFACPALRSKFVEFRSLEALALTVHVQPAGKGVGVAISNLAGATVLESDFEAGAKVSDLESFFQEQKLCPERVSFISPDGQVQTKVHTLDTSRSAAIGFLFGSPIKMGPFFESS